MKMLCHVDLKMIDEMVNWPTLASAFLVKPVIKQSTVLNIIPRLFGFTQSYGNFRALIKHDPQVVDLMRIDFVDIVKRFVHLSADPCLPRLMILYSLPVALCDVGNNGKSMNRLASGLARLSHLFAPIFCLSELYNGAKDVKEHSGAKVSFDELLLGTFPDGIAYTIGKDAIRSISSDSRLMALSFSAFVDAMLPVLKTQIDEFSVLDFDAYYWPKFAQELKQVSFFKVTYKLFESLIVRIDGSSSSSVIIHSSESKRILAYELSGSELEELYVRNRMESTYRRGAEQISAIDWLIGLK